ncbi:G-type lectin S-receptor-like serine/threonine-protein kinase At4g03230 [Durio zibethinus]|uniref:non-specific serine/threonine protein kinase n=1 Tax=Durio zibethinus TaxID=66656 RepID=A0A6P5WMK7_DURZI|nr:G-type lectin S-receptor-like serine/threonine-protein kinase At4g03230 [Durio zibethinus]
MTFVDFPSGRSVLEYVSSAVECEAVCLSNCSCLAYSYDLKCLQWYGDLFDLKQLAINDSDGKNFYLKLPISELTKGKENMQLWIIVILTISLLMFILGLCIHYVRRKLHGQGGDLLKFDLAMSLNADHTELTEENMRSARKKPEVKLPLFNFASVSAATNGFSSTNKLGEGGFGPVYKGILLKGDEIAVKRLSKRSGQGWEELKNEALVIAKLQHKNLVRLLGCCIEKDEKIIIYEFMPNKSLDFFLFDSVRRRILDWEIRVRIIEGIAQGLLYLHQYSRVRIIHRDLKASNILLDNNMNPKISDFGMAKIFGGDELQANTNRIVGTYGYMSPEYALEGLFSIKSDVFSFGVLLLEILSGKKNTGFYQSNSLHLLGHAWDLWISNKGSELIDPVLEEVSTHLAMRYINIGLLCVQERADDRPTMSDVVSMLNNESLILLSPKQPAFLNVRSIANLPLVKSRQEICSVNDVTFSAFQAR